MVSAVVNGDIGLAARGLFNSLEQTVLTKYPLLAIIAEELDRAGALGVLLCGSGASVFGLGRDRAHALGIEKTVGEAMGTWLWRRTVKVLPDGVTVAHGPLEARV